MTKPRYSGTPIPCAWERYKNGVRVLQSLTDGKPLARVDPKLDGEIGYSGWGVWIPPHTGMMNLHGPEVDTLGELCAVEHLLLNGVHVRVENP